MDTVQDEEDSSQHLGNELLDGDADYDEIEPGAPDTSAVTEQKLQASQNKEGKGNL
jgi:hypothetical protein